MCLVVPLPNLNAVYVLCNIYFSPQQLFRGKVKLLNCCSGPVHVVLTRMLNSARSNQETEVTAFLMSSVFILRNVALD